MADTETPISFALSTDADKSAILELMQRIYPDYGYTDAFFEWQYNQNPAGKARIFNIKDGNKIIGIYCMIPNKFYWRGQDFIMWRIQNVMVDETYRGLKLFQRLMHFSQTHTVFTHEDLFFAFPNENSYRSFQNEAFLSLTHPPFWYYRKNTANTSLESNTYTLREFSDIPQEVNTLIHSVCQNIREGIVYKDKHFLTWRYMQRPFGHYKYYGLMHDSVLEGFTVIKYYDDGAEKKLHVCELIIRDNNPQIKKELLRQITYIKEQENASVLNIFQTINGEEKHIAEAGFEQDFMDTRWIVFKGNEETTETFGKPENFDFSLGDNDIF